MPAWTASTGSRRKQLRNCSCDIGRVFQLKAGANGKNHILTWHNACLMMPEALPDDPLDSVTPRRPSYAAVNADTDSVPIELTLPNDQV